MGACCSRDESFEGSKIEDLPDGNERNAAKHEDDDNNYKPNVDDNNEHHVKFGGSSNCVSMFSQQGRKGINQDAMNVWESFNGEKDSFFCAVFDGHGPSGHKVAQKVRDLLPLKLFSSFKYSQSDGLDGKKYVEKNPFFSLWKMNLLNSFEQVDEELYSDGSFDKYCSGCTAVAILKQENHLVIANLGDSRAVLCTRGEKNEILSLQLTVDLKPNLPSEEERIKKCEGRVFALHEQPEVFRLWMPEESYPGLAMARAFGDFCLKDFGLISTPEVFYRKLTENDEFVVLATDGIWDVLSNDEVVKIVASAKRRSTAARLLVSHAVRAWRLKYPTSRADDCTAICLFLKCQPLLTKSISELSRSSNSYAVFWHSNNSLKTEDGLNNKVNFEAAVHSAAVHSRTKTFPHSSSYGLSRRTFRSGY